MNKHLNIFTTYAKENRVYQLENDLTRALAICFQEDTLFFHEVLKSIFGDSNLYNQLFEDLNSEAEITIEIQKNTRSINGFDRVFAVSLSESKMSDFWAQTHNAEYDPVCDLVVTINNILIVIEAKRDNVDCTAQLYNQILNIYQSEEQLNDCKEDVTPFDLNWPKLMAMAVKVSSFEKSTGNANRFLSDFISLVKDHNFHWLPEPPISSLRPKNRPAILRRIDSALTQLCKHNDSIKKLSYRNRLGCTFSKGWANEILFNIDENSGELITSIYPGNTRGQGHHIFKKTPKFHKEIKVPNCSSYPVTKNYHINFRGQSYITGLWLSESSFKKKLYTKENFQLLTGRKYREHWQVIAKVLDDHILGNWKDECQWEAKVINSNRSRFDMAFGYEISFRIPFNQLVGLDTIQKDITPLMKLIGNIYTALEVNLIKT